MLWRSEMFPNDTAKILWVHGPAGYGKSILCAAIIKSLGTDETFRVIHYFCMSASYSDEDSATIPRTWISQMVGPDDNLLEAAHDHLRQSNYETSNTFIWELFTTLVRHGPSFIFVIDGLDEHILQKDRGAFLDRLWKVLAGTAHRVLIVSRNEVEVRAQLTGPQARNLNFYEHEISPEDVRSDLVLFSNSVVNTRLANKNDAVRNELAEQLANKCDGMFLWKDLQRRSLCSWKNPRQLHQAIEEMPEGLESIYQQSWDHILKLPSRDKSRALKILRWATFSTRPLTVAELVEILLVPDEGRFEDLPLDELPDDINDEYTTEEISGLCRSLLNVRRMTPTDPLTSATIHLRHFSIKQFILGTDARMALSDTSIDAPLGLEMHNNYMARACLLYLSCPSVAEDLEGRGLKRPFIDYAARSWYKHMSPAGRQYGELMSLLKTFFALGNAAWDRWCLRLLQLWKQDHPDEHTEDFTASRTYCAASYGLNEVVRFLHAQDTSPLNHPGGAYGTPIKAACAAGHFGLVREISQLGADLNASVGHNGTVLGVAASQGNSEICKYLLTQGARAIGADSLGRTPIYIASSNGHVDVVKLLLDHGADHGHRATGATLICIDRGISDASDALFG
jgi:Ankyrin repeats (3 copies)/NACHT domain